MNFNQVSEAQVTLQYEDRDNGVDLIEDVFKLDKDHSEHRFSRVIFKPRKNPYRYRVNYFMKENGKEFKSDWQSGVADKLFINDPFSASRTVSVRGFGDFAARIDSIFVDLVYRDEENNYGSLSPWRSVKRSTSSTGRSGHYRDGRTGDVLREHPLQGRHVRGSSTTVSDRNTIMLGDVALTQSIQLVPDLINFDLVKLVKVTLHYADEANGIDETKDFLFKKGARKRSGSLPTKTNPSKFTNGERLTSWSTDR
ncbi:hypothetical protein [Cohnella faecalis]|uniref:Uncharacterized protein n=1 Tax=Cohnella faecalis TaxID=2315694 RepID=A0A398CUQ7_9BACL|nr:hypothetical protein [Cohnella faecalis]RIE03597.1 hypothetical protein D3H35_10685 [Cohnella faecalis]